MALVGPTPRSASPLERSQDGQGLRCMCAASACMRRAASVVGVAWRGVVGLGEKNSSPVPCFLYVYADTHWCVVLYQKIRQAGRMEISER